MRWIAILLTTVVVSATAACASEDPAPAPTAGPAYVASDVDREAQAALDAYLELLYAMFADPASADLDDLDDVASGQAHSAMRQAVTQYAERGLTRTGTPDEVSRERIAIDPHATDGLTAVFASCFDLTAVSQVVDGEDSPADNDFQLVLFHVAQTDDGWRVAHETVYGVTSC